MRLGVRWQLDPCRLGRGYVVRVPNDALNGSTGRRWYAIAGGRGLGHYRNRRAAVAAVLKAVKP